MLTEWVLRNYGRPSQGMLIEFFNGLRRRTLGDELILHVILFVNDCLAIIVDVGWWLMLKDVH